MRFGFRYLFCSGGPYDQLVAALYLTVLPGLILLLHKIPFTSFCKTNSSNYRGMVGRRGKKEALALYCETRGDFIKLQCCDFNDNEYQKIKNDR